MLIADATSEDPQTPIKLADFGLSADIKKDPLMHEPCGTPEYVGANPAEFKHTNQYVLTRWPQR